MRVLVLVYYSELFTPVLSLNHKYLFGVNSLSCQALPMRANMRNSDFIAQNDNTGRVLLYFLYSLVGSYSLRLKGMNEMK